MSKVLRGKYFKGQSIWEMKIRASDSWMWRSIISARDLLERGARKRVGDGRTIDIWRDKWIMDRGKGKVFTSKPPNCQLQKVYELIQNGKWNVDKIKVVFSEEDCKRIIGILLSICNGKDKLVWPYSTTRVSIGKTGYMVAKKIQKEKNGKDTARSE